MKPVILLPENLLQSARLRERYWARILHRFWLKTNETRQLLKITHIYYSSPKVLSWNAFQLQKPGPRMTA